MDPVEDAIRAAAQEKGIDPAFALAVAERESSFNPAAHNSSTILGLYQMSGALRNQYGAGNSLDPYTQARSWGDFMNDTRAQMAARLGRQPSDSELYLAHYFGEGRAARMASGEIPPDASVRDVFTPREIAENPEIARAGTVGSLVNKVGGDIDRRVAKWGGDQADPMQGAGADFASFGQPADMNAEPNSNSSPQGIDFTQFGKPAAGNETAAAPDGADFAAFGKLAQEQPPASAGTSADNVSAPDASTPQAEGGNSITPLSHMLSQMAPNGFDYSDWRRSDNLVDKTQQPLLETLYGNFKNNVGKMWNAATGQHDVPPAPGEDIDPSEFGLSYPPDAGMLAPPTLGIRG